MNPRPPAKPQQRPNGPSERETETEREIMKKESPILQPVSSAVERSSPPDSSRLLQLIKNTSPLPYREQQEWPIIRPLHLITCDTGTLTQETGETESRTPNHIHIESQGTEPWTRTTTLTPRGVDHRPWGTMENKTRGSEVMKFMFIFYVTVDLIFVTTFTGDRGKNRLYLKFSFILFSFMPT